MGAHPQREKVATLLDGQGIEVGPLLGPEGGAVHLVLEPLAPICF